MSGKVHQSKTLFDKALNAEASKNYNLSIQVSLDGFSFCIYDILREKFLALASWDFQDVNNYFGLNLLFREFLPEINWLQYSYNKTSVLIDTPQSTLVPNVLYKSDYAEQYLRFNHYVSHSGVVMHDYLPLLDAENIWSVENMVLDTLSAVLPDARFHHYSSPLIESLLLQNKNRGAEESVFANVRRNRFDVVVLKGNSLLFFNSFSYQTKQDFMYFLGYVLEYLELNPEIVMVTLLGEIEKDSALYEIAYKYVRNIRFGVRNEDFKFSYVFDDLPRHFYFPLIHLQQCGL
jgi:hypothetical protein